MINLQAHRIADLAIQLDTADRTSFEYEKNGARLAARDARTQADRLRAQLADAIAGTTGNNR